MRAGGQRVKVQVWRNVKTGVTALNEPIFTETLWKTTWASLVQRRGREQVEGSQVFSLSNYLFTIRYFSVEGIESSMWLVLNGMRLNIVNLDPDYTKKNWTVVEATVADQVA